MPVDDEISKKVEKQDENLTKLKDKNRIVEYLIMVSAEMANNIAAAKPNRQCLANEMQTPKMTVIQSQEDNIIMEDMGPGLPRPQNKYRNGAAGGSPGSKSTTSSNKIKNR